MKQIINGKLYDTATADMIGRWSNCELYGDFSYIEENLYKTRKGNYFLCCYGGPLTGYGVTVGNERRFGVEIIPISMQEAIKWAERKFSVSEFRSMFPTTIVEEA